MTFSIKEFLRKYVVAAVTSSTIFGGVFGAVLTDVGNFRATNRDIAKRQIEVSEKADRELTSILQKFADKAVGKTATTDDDLKSLKQKVQDAFSAAENLKNRYPAANAEFDSYADALVLLQQTAESMSGPLDAKGFVESVSKYYASKQKFDKRLTAIQTSWSL